MIISIFGTNGMLSTYLSKFFFQKDQNTLNLYGIEKPKGYSFSNYTYIDLVKDNLDYTELIKSDLIIYAAGAGVQSSVDSSSELMYQLNLYTPINICNKLKEYRFQGSYISFGSYMEIGLNNNNNKLFDENDIELSPLPVTNDYALSKRLLTRFMSSFISPYNFYHFILPNMFIRGETGTRLIPYVLDYLKKSKNGEPCDEPRFSSGSQIRQYIDLEEVCHVISKSYEIKITSGIYNIGGGELLTIRELIIRLFDFYKTPISENLFGKETRRDGDIKCLKIDGRKLMKEISFLPKNKIESIL